MQQERRDDYGIIWPGFGVAMGTAIGMLIGTMFVEGALMAMAIGAGVGLVLGAVIALVTRQSRMGR